MKQVIVQSWVDPRPEGRGQRPDGYTNSDIPPKHKIQKTYDNE